MLSTAEYYYHRNDQYQNDQSVILPSLVDYYYHYCGILFGQFSKLCQITKDLKYNLWTVMQQYFVYMQNALSDAQA